MAKLTSFFLNPLKGFSGTVRRLPPGTFDGSPFILPPMFRAGLS